MLRCNGPFALAAVAMLALTIAGCAQRPQRAIVSAGDLVEIDADEVYLKAHMRDGHAYIFSSWTVETSEVFGQARLLDANRDMVDSGWLHVSVDDVAIFETNQLRPSPSIAGMTIITALSLAVTVGCATNPKACFGSCPTFYVEAGDQLLLEAEGFSGSVTPALESRDIDALCRATPSQGTLELVMRNEALETHVVRTANVLRVPRSSDGRVFHTATVRSSNGLQPTGREYWQTGAMRTPTHATGPEGDCSELVAQRDFVERVSLADSTDLATTETLEVVFDSVPDEDVGLVLTFRQTLLTTYLFYQTLAYMGPSVGSWFARLETGGETMRALVRWAGSALGGIRVLVADGDGGWTLAEEVYETGPLATNTIIVPLEDCRTRPLHVRLEMAKGAWRIDFVGLAELRERVDAVRVPPSRVRREGRTDPAALDALLDTGQQLITFPGDEYTLVYDLPANGIDQELFLETQGYYLEWMRGEWVAEEDAEAAAKLLFDTPRAMIELAPAFKRIEAQMEATFWRSRYAEP